MSVDTRQKLIKELARRRKAAEDAYFLRPALSEVQLEVISSPNRFKVLRCGRRAGKTHLIAHKMIYTCLKRKRASVLYIGLTRESAKEIVWESLKEVLELNGIQYTAYESALKIIFSNGSYIRVVGADLQKAQQRLRGLAWDLVVVDECGFSETADSLIHIVLPSVSDHGGSIWMASSPGEPRGFFYEADQDPAKAKHWEHWTWTLLQNPFYGEERGRAEMQIACDLKYGGDWNHPMFQQEYFAQWNHDKSSYLFHYSEDKNTIKLTTDMYGREVYDIPNDLTERVISLDFGFNDKTVIRVGEYSPFRRDFYFLEYWEATQCLDCDVAEVLLPMIEKYQPRRIVGDMGGLGKPYAEGLRRIYGIPIECADKTEKAAAIRLFNSDLYSGYIKFKLNDPIIKEMQKLLKDPETGIEKEGMECDHCDAALYGWKASNCYNLAVRKPDLTEEEKMFEMVLRQQQEKHDQERNDNDFNQF